MINSAIRQLESESDRNFVESYWLDSYRHSSSYGRGIPSDIYFEEHRNLVRKAMKSFPTLLWYDEVEPDHVFGFINGYQLPDEDSNVLNYIYIKKKFRKLSGAMMLHDKLYKSHENLIITHQGFIGNIKKKYKKVSFNPYLFYKL